MMKILFLILCLLIGVQTSAQENNQITAPVIVAKIPLGETATFEGTTFTFESVMEDSRCPKDVTCVWEGEAKIRVVIETGSDRKVMQMIFRGEHFGTDEENLLVETKTKKLFGYRLSPYPETKLPKEERDYQLEVLMQNK
jgi:hypothetical protein